MDTSRDTRDASGHLADDTNTPRPAADLAPGDPGSRAGFLAGGRQSGGGQSGGGAYPNPHAGKEGGEAEGFMGHGGQTEMAYHGTGRLGEERTGDNPNAPAGTAGSDDKD
jgi:hypothetical protein